MVDQRRLVALLLWTELHSWIPTKIINTKSFAHLELTSCTWMTGSAGGTPSSWSNNKEAWSLTNEYRRVTDQAILIFNLKLAREMQPLNAPQLLNEMETLLVARRPLRPLSIVAAAE